MKKKLVEAAAIIDAQEKAEEEECKAEEEECKSKEERRVLLNKWKTEEIVRKQREREKRFEKYLTEHPVPIPPDLLEALVSTLQRKF